MGTEIGAALSWVRAAPILQHPRQRECEIEHEVVDNLRSVHGPDQVLGCGNDNPDLVSIFGGWGTWSGRALANEDRPQFIGAPIFNNLILIKKVRRWNQQA
jgi:hypothetical protein